MATFSKLNRLIAASAVTVIVGFIMMARAEDVSAPTSNLGINNATLEPGVQKGNSNRTGVQTIATTAVPDGKELFQREWIANDPRSHGGDGLGPVYNDSSCIACHNQGGSGGGGPANKNVDIITAFSNAQLQQRQVEQQGPAVVQTLPGMILNVFVDSLTQGSGSRPTVSRGTLVVSGNTAATATASAAASSSSIGAQPNASQPASTATTAQANIQISVVDGQPANGHAQPTVDNAQTAANQPAENSQSVQASTSPAVAAQSVPNLVSASTAAPIQAVVNQTAPAPSSQPSAEDRLAEIKKQKAELAKIHPGFLSARSVVLHRFSTDDKYDAWRMQMLGLSQFNQPNANPFDDSQSSNDTAAAQPAADSADQQPAASTDGVATPATPTVRIQIESDADADRRMQQLKTQSQMNQFAGLQGQVQNFTFIRSRRNPTALFGVGLIDQIPDQALIDQAKKEFKDFPEIQGRVAKMKDGKLGRFGWKDQKASLYEFAMTACAVELGLDVPDHPQAGMPQNPNYKPKGHDMNEAECVALVDYLRNLPAPTQHKATTPQEAQLLSAGQKQFAAVGCANCHAEKLGNVTGIYSDLLLHDMGQDLGDSGNYGVFVPDTPEEEQQEEPIPSLQAGLNGNENGGSQHAQTKAEREKTFGALRQEWRTPPLWGVRDSAPYLHDGRAETLEQAIAFHGGEASNSAKLFFMLKPEERAQVVAFLKSLIAPEQASAE